MFSAAKSDNRTYHIFTKNIYYHSNKSRQINVNLICKLAKFSPASKLCNSLLSSLNTAKHLLLKILY